VLTIEQIAKDLQVSKRHAYDLVKAEHFPRAVVISKQVKRWIPEEFEAWKRRLPRER
jgi:predicted DNA-binding transcriptional regulator AlpA